MKIVHIRGRNRLEARKKVIDYWFTHREQMHGTMKDFLRKCSVDPTGRVITYKE